jgi:parvulin-like peptidyl-prolyl isomerase
MARQPNQQNLTKKHLARLERERLQQRYLVAGTIVVLVLVIGIVIYGVLDQTVLKALKPVAKVGSTTVTTSAFQKEVKFQRYQYIQQLSQLMANPIMLQFYGSYVTQIQSQLTSPTTIGQSVLDGMVEDELVKQEAQKRGITVTDAEVDQAFQEAFGFFPNGTLTPTVTSTPFSTETLSPTQQALLPPTSTPDATKTVIAETATAEAVKATEQAVTTLTPAGPTSTPTLAVTETPTPAATATSNLTPTPSTTPTVTLTPTPYTTQGFNSEVNKFVGNLKALNYSRDDLRALIRRQLLRQKVTEAITKDVPTTAEEVWARHILVKTEDEAKKVEERLANGEKFDDVAKEVSTDTGSKDQGGDLGWFTKGQMVKPFEDAAFALKIGETSQPVKSDFGYHVIQVLGHEVRPLTAQQLADEKTKAFQTWLDNAKKEKNVQTFDTWTSAVPTEPAIPADLQAQLDQLNSSSTNNQGLPVQSLPQPTAAGPSQP